MVQYTSLTLFALCYRDLDANRIPTDATEEPPPPYNSLPRNTDMDLNNYYSDNNAYLRYTDCLIYLSNLSVLASFPS